MSRDRPVGGGGPMATGYQVLAWDASSVRVGRLLAGWLELTAVGGGLRLDDIRNCSAARGRTWGAATGVERTDRRHALWRFDLHGDDAQALLHADYLLHNAVDPSGRAICYTAPPWTTRGDMSLHVLDLEGRESTLTVDGSVSRACIPSWRAPGRVLYHTEGNEVVEVDLATGRTHGLFAGEHPTASPDGRRIAYRDGNVILVTGDGEDPVDASPRRGLGEGSLRGGMSWSPDGRYLLFGHTGGVLGYEMEFSALEVATGERTKVRQRYLQGIRFL